MPTPQKQRDRPSGIWVGVSARKGGVGKFCREREAAVAERRQILDAAMASVGQVADPQTEAE
jgi:hypothetical protein